MTKTLLMIARHGNTFASGDIVTRLGVTDTPLVEKGLEQGRRLGRYLTSAGLIPDAVFTSSLKRTIQTAEQAQFEMGTSLPARSLAVFDEIDYGVDENKPEKDVVARLGAAAIKAWDTDAIVPDGWKIDPEAIVRNWKIFADDVLKNYKGKKVLVITSNGIARFSPHLTGDFEGFRADYGLKISTSALCVFEYDNATLCWVCKEWNLKPD